MTLFDSLTAWIDSFLACIGLGQRDDGCLGQRQSGEETRLVNENEDQWIIERQWHGPGEVWCTHSFSEDFWGSSNGDLGYAFGVVAQRSISSFSTLTLMSFHSDTNNDFVNHGLRLWNQTRVWWIGAIKSSNEAHLAQQNAISLLNSKEQFRRPIPLSEMVDFLVDSWEQEGFYD